MITKLLNRKLVLTLTSLCAVGALAAAGLFAPATAYAAAPADDPAPTPQGPFGDGIRLEYACRQQKLILEVQQNRLDFANEIAGRAQAWIDQLKGQGQDTSALETALAAYKAAIATAQGQHDTAQNAYNAHAGFDDNCQVTDREQARNTVRTVNENLRIAHRTLSNGNFAFRLAIREWRRTHRPAAVTVSP